MAKCLSKPNLPSFRQELLAYEDIASACKLLQHFPNERQALKCLFEIRGGPTFACPECGYRTSWHRTSNERVRRSKCCAYELNVVAGTWLAQLPLDIQSWVYLLSLFSNRSRPLDLHFISQHFDISRGKASRALRIIRNRIQAISAATFEPHKFSECYVDEFLYFHAQRRSQGRCRDPTHGTWVLGISGPAGLRVFAAPKARRDYGPWLHHRGLRNSQLLTCNVWLCDELAKQAFHVELAEVSMATRGKALADARARLSGFWPYFKRHMWRASYTSRGAHLNRYLDDYAFRFQENGNAHRIFVKLLASIEQF